MGMRNQVRSTVDDSKVDQRLAREPNRGEVKFKQIKLVDKRSHNEILLLIRKWNHWTHVPRSWHIWAKLYWPSEHAHLQNRCTPHDLNWVKLMGLFCIVASATEERVMKTEEESWEKIEVKTVAESWIRPLPIECNSINYTREERCWAGEWLADQRKAEYISTALPCAWAESR